MSKLTPESLAQCGSEHGNQAALFCWAALPEQQAKYPMLKLMFAIPNGGERNLKVAGNLKAEGVKAGVLDIFLPVARQGFHGLWIEMKVGDNKASALQLQFAAGVNEQGFAVRFCYSWIEARDVLISYLA